MKKNKIEHYSDKEALEFHNSNKSGKIEINSSKPMTSKRDLALAYSPGVAAPVKEIFKNVTNYNSISEEMVKRYAPNVVEGVSNLSNWAKNL